MIFRNRFGLPFVLLTGMLGACSSSLDPVAISPDSGSAQLTQVEVADAVDSDDLDPEFLESIDEASLRQTTFSGIIQKLPLGNRLGRLSGFWQVGDQTLYVRRSTELEIEDPEIGDIVTVTGRNFQDRVIIASQIESGISVQEAVGNSPEDVAEAIAAFEADLGGQNNGGAPVSFPTGFRSINWDAAPDGVSAPNDFPADFFNFDASPRARGALFAVEGQTDPLPLGELQLSANLVNPTNTAPEFGNINPTYPDLFKTRSPERLFAYTDDEDTTFDVLFFVPGTIDQPAVVKGFGAVFTDVDVEGDTILEYFDDQGNSVLTLAVPAGVGDESLSFLGVTFPAELHISRVRITSGSSPIGQGANDGVLGDVVVMDDFIYGEPKPLNGLPTDPS